MKRLSIICGKPNRKIKMLILFYIGLYEDYFDGKEIPGYNIISPARNKEQIFHKGIRKSKSIGIEPRVLYKKKDLERAYKNIELHKWAKNKNTSNTNHIKKEALKITDDYVKNMIPEVTPATTTFCPHCVLNHFNWHANGNWKWSPNDPEHITCNVCGTVYPNEKYPENLVYQSNYDSTQKITFYDMEPQKCMGYFGCKPSINGLIRNKKLASIIGSIPSYGITYQLTKDKTIAEAARKIYLRMAEVFPHYLVYEGYSYNEYADCEPRYAALNLLNLSKDPTKKCRLISATGYKENPEGMYSGYWSSSRLGTSGMDGGNVANIVIGYDLLREVFTEEERKRIEENVIEEMSVMFVGDPNINNKAVGNREGAAYAGLAIDNHELSEFGLEGGKKVVSEYFLKDGGGSETPAYTFMTVSSLYRMGFVFDEFNKETNFRQVFQHIMWSSYGNYYYPALHDSYNTTTMPDSYAEFINYAFPGELSFNFTSRILNKTKEYPPLDALFFRDPNQKEANEDLFSHPDVVFPYLKESFIRTGERGERSLLLLDAGDYGGHHHDDGLGLIYWKEGHELLMDLGYLWDHVDAAETHYTKVHNTVVLNQEDQIKEGRNGSSSIFFIGNNIKMAQSAVLNAYKDINVYNRTVIQIQHDSSDYVLDIFRVKGGQQRQYAFHGPNIHKTEHSDLIYDKYDKQEERYFCIRMMAYSEGWFELSDIQLINLKDSAKSLTKPFPDETPTECPKNGTYCLYNGGGSIEWKSVPGKETRGVRIEANATEDGKCNIGFVIGNSNGYTGENTFKDEIGAKYVLTWWQRGSVAPTVNSLSWSDPTDPNDRSSFYMSMTEKPELSETEWRRCKVEFDLVKKIDSVPYGLTDNEWSVDWNVTDNYTFTVTMPKRNYKVGYEDGWGQRLHTDLDKGAKLPYYFVETPNDSNFSTFVAVFEGHSRDKESLVKKVEVVDSFGNGDVAIKIDTNNGSDLVLSSFTGNKLSAFGHSTDANVAVFSEVGKIMIGGSSFDGKNKGAKMWNGVVDKFINDEGSSYVDLKGKFSSSDFIGQCLHIQTDDGVIHPYMCQKVENISGGVRYYTRYKSIGFKIVEGGRWYVHRSVNLDFESNEKDSDSVVVIGLSITVITVSIIGISIGVFKYIQRRKIQKSHQNTEEILVV